MPSLKRWGGNHAGRKVGRGGRGAGPSLWGTVIGHLIATTVVTLSALGLSIVAYFGLLTWAIVADAPLGGPLGLVGMMLFGLFGGLAVSVVALLPTAVAGRFACRRIPRLSVLWEIPATTCLLFLFSVLGASWISDTLPAAAMGGTATWIGLLLPLGLYWWVQTLTAFGLAEAGRWVAMVARSRSS